LAEVGGLRGCKTGTTTASDKRGLLPEKGLSEWSAGRAGRYKLRNSDIREYINSQILNENFRECILKCLDMNTASSDEKEFCLLSALFSITFRRTKLREENQNSEEQEGLEKLRESDKSASVSARVYESSKHREQEQAITLTKNKRQKEKEKKRKNSSYLAEMRDP
jgi:hypothetical protein